MISVPHSLPFVLADCLQSDVDKLITFCYREFHGQNREDYRKLLKTNFWHS